jgi:hypothetical protein
MVCWFSKKYPLAPDALVMFPIDGNAKASVWGGSLGVFVQYRTGGKNTYITLIGANSSSGEPTFYHGFQFLKPGMVGYIDMVAKAGTTLYSPHGYDGVEYWAEFDPLLYIDPTATVLVNGIAVPATDAYTLEFSPGFRPTNGVPEPSTFAGIVAWRSRKRRIGN